MKKINFSKLALTLALVCSASFLQAADVYLSSPLLGGDDLNDGLTPETAIATLSKAYAVINAAAGVNTIYVSGEVDGYSNPADAQGVYPFLGASYTLVVQGVDGTSPKIVGNDNARMFRLRADMVLKLKDLTLSGTVGNSATFDGGCIQMQGGSLEADNCIFENFTTANYGAVIHTQSVSVATPFIAFRNCVFRNNSATGSTGYGSVMRIADWGSKADDTRANAKLYVENCAFVNNSALYGTFFFRTNFVADPYPAITFVNSTFTGNTNTNGNSGCLTVYSGNETVNVINCTFKNNLDGGSGIRVTNTATVNVYNTIAEGNTWDFNADNNPTLFVSNSLLLKTRNIPDYTKPATYTSTDQLLDAFDTETNTYTPLAGSLAINFGAKQYLENLGADGTLTLAYDQLNNPRPFTDDFCDAGAIETDKIAPVITVEAQDEATDYNAETNDADFTAWLAANGNAEATDRTAITWSNDFDAENWIAGENNGKHIAVTFTATDAWGNATPTTATFTINGTITGINTTPAAGFVLYRADGKLMIQSGNEIFRIELISVSGQTIRTSLNNEISMENIAKGVYLVKVNNSVVRKVVL
ncbi:MAG: T9SS type A sorting domain-containing protein [Dysgonamonadaceae bacterium]|nr:T9SS type A sorting domain-containing protein [Dysgonamonadaceae bacterium]